MLKAAVSTKLMIKDSWGNWWQSSVTERIRAIFGLVGWLHVFKGDAFWLTMLTCFYLVWGGLGTRINTSLPRECVILELEEGCHLKENHILCIHNVSL